LAAATYNGQHEPLTTTDAAGQVTNYQYNGAGQILSSATPMGETTHYNYDSAGNLLSVTPPQPGAGVTYTYDSVGRVHTKTDAVSGTLAYTYDNGDRVVQVGYPDGTRQSYIYNKLDLQTSTDRQGRTTSYVYDNDRRVTSVTDPKGNQTQWIRDLEGRIIQKTFADGSSYTYQYDPGAGKPSFLTDAKKQVTKKNKGVRPTFNTLSETVLFIECRYAKS
jgi:YD repeat-containing protein